MRALVGSLGPAMAVSSHRQCLAAGDLRTLSERIATAGMSLCLSAACIVSASLWVRTRTAMSLGRIRRLGLPSSAAGSQAVSKRSWTFSGKVVGDRLHGILGADAALVGAGQVVSESQA